MESAVKGAEGNVDLVGRGNREAGRLVREWFAALSAAADRGEGAAYVFVMGSLTELLRCFDLPIVFPEINSLQTAVRRVAHEYLNEAEDAGYSPDICAYVKADVAVQRRSGAHPMGTIPPPRLAVLTNACNTYIKWAEIWERMHGAPVFTLDVPGTRQEGRANRLGDRGFRRDHAYVAHQLHELIRLCEQVTGRRFDIDRLRENLEHANAMNAAWRKILALNAASPAPFNALMDGTVYLGVLNGFRGSPEGAAYFADLVEELEYKVERRIGTVTDEAHRLIFVGVPCYPIFRNFNEFFTTHGGNFVLSTYLWFAAGGAECTYDYDTSRPIESLAEGLLLSVSGAMDAMFFPVQPLLDRVEKYRIDGIVFHPIKSCRTTSTGMADSRRAFMQSCNIPSLVIESDMMDRRVVSEAQLKNRIDAFFEGLASRKRLAKEAS